MCPHQTCLYELTWVNPATANIVMITPLWGIASKQPEDMVTILCASSGLMPRAKYLGTNVSNTIPIPPEAEPVIAHMIFVAIDKEINGCMGSVNSQVETTLNPAVAAIAIP